MWIVKSKLLNGSVRGGGSTVALPDLAGILRPINFHPVIFGINLDQCIVKVDSTMPRKYIRYNFSILLNVILLFYIIHQHLNLSEQPEIVVTEKLDRAPYCNRFDQHHRLAPGDLSADLVTVEVFQDEIFDWDICKSQKSIKKTDAIQNSSSGMPLYTPLQYCLFEPMMEQSYQYRFYGTGDAFRWPDFSTCVILPPKNYQWPSKLIKFPSSPGESAVFWSNLGLTAFNDVIIFDPLYPRNMYHFDAPFYDPQQEDEVNLAAQYIPFGRKVRTMLEIGDGDGSLSVSLHKRDDITVINTIQPEFPYCEYITERSGLCVLLEPLRPMPIAKFSFDVVHHSWVYHALFPTQWRSVLLQQNRLLRPGGYLWIQDGSSTAVFETIKYLLVEQMGYRILHKWENILRGAVTMYFGLEPFETEWTFIFVKPNRLKVEQYPCQ